MSATTVAASPPLSPPLERVPFELENESDFDLIDSDGFVSVCGFGALLSEKSARSLFPNLINFRLARLTGFRRVFAHAAPLFFDHGIAKPRTKEMARLSVEPCEGERFVVTTFQIPRSEVPAFVKWGHEFRFLAVTLETLNGLFYPTPAVLCARYSDEEYFQNRCKGSESIFFERCGRYGISKIWSDDLLPCPVYLRHCILAAENLYDIAYSDFLDHTYLGDCKTTVRQYLERTGSSVMEEETPQQLKHLYEG